MMFFFICECKYMLTIDMSQWLSAFTRGSFVNHLICRLIVAMNGCGIKGGNT